MFLMGMISWQGRQDIGIAHRYMQWQMKTKIKTFLQNLPNKANTGRWGKVRHFLAFFWLRVFSAPKQKPRQPQRHSPQI